MLLIAPPNPDLPILIYPFLCGTSLTGLFLCVSPGALASLGQIAQKTLKHPLNRADDLNSSHLSSEGEGICEAMHKSRLRKQEGWLLSKLDLLEIVLHSG